MSQTLQTVLLSLGTSLIVSLITFILGLKSGKNQTDRTKLQGIYKQLHSHFSDLKISLSADRPKSWQYYKKVEHGLYAHEYFPPAKELKRTGDILFIKKSIAKEAIELEEALMIYAGKLTYHIPDLHSALISDLNLYKEGYIFKNYQGKKNETSHFETANPLGCNRFRSLNYQILYNKDRIANMLQILSDCSVQLTSGGNPANYSIKIYPNGLAVDTEEYSNRIIEAFKSNINDYEKLCNEKDKLFLRIDKLNKKLERRVREPISFWETMFGAFADIFR